MQISKDGLGNILRGYVFVSNSQIWAKKSSGKLLNYFENKNVSIAKVFTEAESIQYSGRKFRQACYILEGDYNLVFQVDHVL